MKHFINDLRGMWRTDPIGLALVGLAVLWFICFAAWVASGYV